jgi:hypothetical protein
VRSGGGSDLSSGENAFLSWSYECRYRELVFF